MTDGARAITDDEQERPTAIVDALSARGVKLILKNVPGRKYLKVAISVPQGVRVPMDVKQIVQANRSLPLQIHDVARAWTILTCRVYLKETHRKDRRMPGPTGLGRWHIRTKTSCMPSAPALHSATAGGASTIRPQLGQRIRVLREALSFTQEELAEKAGISVSFVSMIERGERTPHVETLVAISDALGITVSPLFLGLNVPPTSRRHKSFPSSRTSELCVLTGMTSTLRSRLQEPCSTNGRRGALFALSSYQRETTGMGHALRPRNRMAVLHSIQAKMC